MTGGEANQNHLLAHNQTPDWEPLLPMIRVAGACSGKEDHMKR